MLAIVVVVVFVFLAPVVPTSVTRFSLLPWHNQCNGGFQPFPDPLDTQVPVYASTSYVVYGLISAARTIHEGSLGLLYVPNDTGYWVQFPPYGYNSPKCL